MYDIALVYTVEPTLTGFDIDKIPMITKPLIQETSLILCFQDRKRIVQKSGKDMLNLYEIFHNYKKIKKEYI